MKFNEIIEAIGIEPYYREDAGVIYCGDCLDILPRMPEKCVDLVVTDPPYGIKFKSNWTNHQQYIQNDSFDDWVKLLPLIFPEYNRIITDSGCCCCCCGGGGGKTPVTALFTIEAIKYLKLIQTLVWRKFIGLGWRYRPSYENIIILSNTSDKYNFYDDSKSCSNVIEGINQDIPVKDEHPTQKPIKLMERLIGIHSVKNHIVLDNFCGTGSTLMAAKQLGRKFIGIEIEEKYCAIAVQRLAQEVMAV